MLVSLLFFVTSFWWTVKSEEFDCPMRGQNMLVHDGSHNYVTDIFQGSKFPFAINQCTATSLKSDNKWYKYVCNNKDDNGNWNITKTEYTDENCTSNGVVINDWQSHYNTSEQNMNKYYQCNGLDSYLQIQIHTLNQCELGKTIYAGLNACIKSGETSYQFYCNDTSAAIQLFTQNSSMELSSTTSQPLSTLLQLSTTRIVRSSPHLNISLTTNDTQTCQQKFLCNVWTLSSECHSTDAFIFGNDSIELYAQMKCAVQLPEDHEDDDKFAVMHSQSIITGILVLLLAIYSL